MGGVCNVEADSMMNTMRYIIITGAAGHLGRAFTLSVSKFSNCIIIDKDSDKLSELFLQLDKKKGQVHEQICVDLKSKKIAKLCSIIW